MQVLKPFRYSTDGVNSLPLEMGDDASPVPADLLPGLIAEGFVADAEPKAKATAKAPKNKAIEAAPENKADTAPEAAADGEAA